jgi:hypothetical protein
MSKTPEEMARRYADEECTGNAMYGDGLYAGFLAGYKAAQHKDKAVNRTHLAWKLAQDYGAVKWLKHKDYKRFGNTERDYEYTIARDGFYQGYQAARDRVADANKVMPDACEHILDVTKMVDVNGWISVKDRLPEIEINRDDYQRSKAVLWIDHEKNMVVASYVTIRERTRVMTGFSEPPISNFTHWQELPEPPKEQK